jgi:hypothetical protein
MALSDGYERLRRAVLAGGAGGWRLGHGVLCARGMCAWIDAFGATAPPVDGEPSRTLPLRFAEPDRRGTPGDRQADQVVAVLAQMTLAIAA